MPDCLTVDSNGYLTPNDQPIYADSNSVKHQFGSGSVVREELWSSVEKLVEITAFYLLPVADIWIGGSFTSLETDPADVDIVIFISYNSFKTMRGILDTLSATFHDLDVKWAPVLDQPDDLSEAINELERMKWFVLFNSDRNGLPKGFVSLQIN